jgi:opacity protein-like surface antigen
MNIKNVAFVAALLASTSAFAADLPSRTNAAAPAFAAPATWSGLYVGVQGGVARTAMKYSDLDWWYSGVVNHVMDGYNAALGLKAGYDMKFGAVLAGVAAEISFGQFRGGGEAVPAPQGPAYDIRSTATMLGSVRGKLGVTTPAVSLFGTAGVAFANTAHKYNETDGSGEYYRVNGKRVGWVVGVGADYALTAKSSVGLEVSHYEFGNDTTVLRNADGTARADRWRQGESFETLMLNYTQRF